MLHRSMHVVMRRSETSMHSPAGDYRAVCIRTSTHAPEWGLGLYVCVLQLLLPTRFVVPYARTSTLLVHTTGVDLNLQ